MNLGDYFFVAMTIWDGKGHSFWRLDEAYISNGLRGHSSKRTPMFKKRSAYFLIKP